MTGDAGVLESSFRDPSGFLFRRNGTLYRQINRSYAESYEILIASGLYDDLVKRGLLIPHRDAEIEPERPEEAYRVIEPEVVPFISYPYEWSFSQLKEAARATLEIEKIALGHGLTLKDASAYNIQFLDGRPVFIDTLSFEAYTPGEPWVAYRQFCQHFLAPLALMAYRDIRLNQLLRVHIDGVPLDLAGSLLPRRSWLNARIAMHLHMHARSQAQYADTHTKIEPPKVNQNALMGLIDSLSNAVGSLTWRPEGTEWAEYYRETNYTAAGLDHKKRIIASFLDEIGPGTVWDLGANVGVFSRLSSGRGIPTVACDIDPACVERNYRDVREKHESHLLPLVVDLTNPSPAIGWDNAERRSMIERGPAEMVFALALVHHLAISNNVPLDRIAAFFAEICTYLVVEFVPKDDSQVKKLLANREDIFAGYTEDAFEEAFGGFFDTLRKESITDSARTLYLMKKRT
ncbi:hypothetical protein [Methanofollis ethanolicus]|uniref:hypothetical protein n=1 Tax=Methanofollis ethanolicus TaxID=488124 RepID=UPI00083310F4|nr:hypothetical protein [Methanofollis ethanolicus]